MIYLAGNNSGCKRLAREGWPVGMMMSPAPDGSPRNPRGLPWAADNGLYHDIKEPPKPREAEGGVYGLLHLAACKGWPKPLFAVVPDVPYDAPGTVARWGIHAATMAATFPAVPLALAVQDGMRPEMLGSFKVRPGAVFVAGSDRWKIDTMAAWCELARQMGIRGHVARVNTKDRLRDCQLCGADSADGTGIWRGDQAQKRGVLLALGTDLLPILDPAQ